MRPITAAASATRAIFRTPRTLSLKWDASHVIGERFERASPRIGSAKNQTKIIVGRFELRQDSAKALAFDFAAHVIVRKHRDARARERALFDGFDRSETNDPPELEARARDGIDEISEQRKVLRGIEQDVI